MSADDELERILREGWSRLPEPDARATQRRRYVPYHRVKGHGGDADGSRPGRVLVRAGDRHRRKEVHRVRRGYLARDRAGHQRVGRQREERAVLLEASDGKDRDLP